MNCILNVTALHHCIRFCCNLPLVLVFQHAQRNNNHMRMDFQRCIYALQLSHGKYLGASWSVCSSEDIIQTIYSSFGKCFQAMRSNGWHRDSKPTIDLILENELGQSDELVIIECQFLQVDQITEDIFRQHRQIVVRKR